MVKGVQFELAILGIIYIVLLSISSQYKKNCLTAELHSKIRIRMLPLTYGNFFSNQSSVSAMGRMRISEYYPHTETVSFKSFHLLL
ncbi:hypothetical protein AB840_13980 [Megasphaera cerevisiae DSM 20462]|uniref:Uncharacterized protein n=1 Tax=Megasphaera cerevisiae DSM 20462 TaxID=1122219 RepID=A0A0J6ZKJ3_9FIRM|nr:hypothetical protein AB840_13980 [Megasphaera cerevisiae DSM 20462]